MSYTLDYCAIRCGSSRKAGCEQYCEYAQALDEIERTKSELEHTKKELSDTYKELEDTKAEVKRTKREINEIKEKYKWAMRHLNTDT